MAAVGVPWSYALLHPGSSCRSRVPALHTAWHGVVLFWIPTDVQLLLHLSPVAYLLQRMHLDAQLPW